MRWLRLGNDFVNLACVLRIVFSDNGRSAVIWFSAAVKMEVTGAACAQLLAYIETESIGGS